MSNIYKIETKGLGNGSHKYTFILDGGFFEAFENDMISDAGITVEATLEKNGPAMRLSMLINGTVTVMCDRCLDNLDLPVKIDETFDVLFSDLSDTSDIADQEISEEKDVVVLDRTSADIDLSQLIYDYVCTSLPIRKVHHDGECNPEMMEKMKNILK